MRDRSHLDALELRLSHERDRFSRDRSELRKVWIEQIEREIAAERKFLGLPPELMLPDMTDDEIVAELSR